MTLCFFFSSYSPHRCFLVFVSKKATGTKQWIRACKKHLIGIITVQLTKRASRRHDMVGWKHPLNNIRSRLSFGRIHKRILILFGLLDIHKAAESSLCKGEEEGKSFDWDSQNKAGRIQRQKSCMVNWLQNPQLLRCSLFV